MNNPFVGKHVEFHILQSFPVTCLNRDDVGAPKTAEVGGATRARVSSQAWKRPVRMALQELGVRLGTRTKKLDQVIKGACIQLGATDQQAQACGEAFIKELAKDTLFFFSTKEGEAFAQYAQSLDFDDKKLKNTEIGKISKKISNSALDGLDIALFGRMVAQQQDMGVNGAASFAHAISTHKISNEVEFFTALDDLQEATGSAHMGSLEFNSATYYRYISLDLGQLYENLSAEDLPHAVELFTTALFKAIPTARQNTQSGASFWDYAKIYIRKGQRLQASFDCPVKAKDGFLAPSITALESFLSLKENQSGSLFGKELELTLGPDHSTSIDDIVAALKKHLS